jgi:hypothetical protein
MLDEANQLEKHGFEMQWQDDIWGALDAWGPWVKSG